MPEADQPQALTDDGPKERPAAGRLLSLDLGQSRVGVAVSDELGITVRPLPAVRRSSWKELLREVAKMLSSFDAKGLVIGLPLNMDGSEGEPAREARRLARNFELSLAVPVYLQDERLTSREAEAELYASGLKRSEVRALVDSAAAAIILRDFLSLPASRNLLETDKP
ncbi:MAG TPA: Holliday junction resolvase RuvX [Pyrinomonadaceae bacterium]